MNNITTIFTNTMINMCDLEIIEPLSKSILPFYPEITNNSYISSPTPLISICIASFITLCSLVYRFFYCTRLTLHFVGIRRPENFTKSQFKLLENADTQSTMVTVKTSLKVTNTVLDLKKVIKNTYSLTNNTNDILISYSNHFISLYKESDKVALQDFGITNNSVLTLALCSTNKINEKEEEYQGIQREINPPEVVPPEEEHEIPARSVNALFDMFQDESEDEDEETFIIPQQEDTETKGFLEPYIGFDVIMQEGGVFVYKMPVCGHEMNKESLYDYAVSTFINNKNLKLQCPHRQKKGDGKCDAEWDLNAVMEVLRHSHKKDKAKEEIDLMKLELLFTRNKVESGDCNMQKCPRCKTLYFKNQSDFKLKLEDIKTRTDIENEFKTACVFCAPEIPKYLNAEKLRDKKHTEKMELERAKQINSMFEMFEDEEEEEEEDELEIQQGLDINAMFNMFQEDENDSEDEEEKYEQKYDENGYLILEANNEFCFGCGEEWVKGHICDNQFRKDLCEILEKAEPKKIGKVEGVPSIRCCPKCCQLLYHIEYCKHMKCKTCKTSFCMVCMKQKLNGSWQCGSSSTVCPIAARQNMETLPDNIVITKQQFRLFDDIDDKKNDEN